MKRILEVFAVAVIATGILAGCGSGGDSKPASGTTASPTTGSTSKPETPKAPKTSVPEPKSDGQMVWLDRLSVPKMEGWEYSSPEEGEADRNRGNDGFIDTKDCAGATLEIPQCPSVIVADEAEGLKAAEEGGFGNPLAGLDRDQMAELALCQDLSKKGTPRKPEGTDDIDGVTAYRYHATLKDCGVDVKTVPWADPKFKGGKTLWIIKTNKVFISILATDSGAKGMVTYTDINKLRYALNHGKWIG